MRPIIKLLKPDYSEIALYSSIGFALLVVGNIQRLWDYTTGGLDAELAFSYTSVAGRLQEKLLTFEAGIDPRFADFTAWLVVGLLAVVLISVGQKFIELGGEDIKTTKKLKNTKFHKTQKQESITRWLLRFAGIILLIIWTRLFFGFAYLEISEIFFNAAVDILDVYSLIAIIYTIFLTGFGLYVFAICARLIALRIRIF